MTAPARPRPHRRARTQLLLGLLPLVAVLGVLLVVLGVRLADARAPLAAATATGQATVVGSGEPPDGRGIEVRIAGADGGAGGEPRTGVLVFREPLQVPAGTELTVRYDPAGPADDTPVFTDGDEAHRAAQDLLFGLVVLGFVLLLATALTLWRLLRAGRLRAAPASEATAARVVVRQGLVVRSWLRFRAGRGERYVPVYWSPELARLAPGSTIELRADAARGRHVLPVIDGAEVWTSGRVRDRAPRGEPAVARGEPDAGGARWGRQLRSDLVPTIAAPLLGLLWAYLDGSGPAGFAVATVAAVPVLFWVFQLLGSDPDPPPR